MTASDKIENALRNAIDPIAQIIRANRGAGAGGLAEAIIECPALHAAIAALLAEVENELEREKTRHEHTERDACLWAGKADEYLKRAGKAETALQAAEQQLITWRDAQSRENHTIEQTLAQAIGGYPWYKDDQNNFPGATEADGVCVGDHVPGSLALEAARIIRAAEQQRQRDVQQARRDAADLALNMRENLGSAPYRGAWIGQEHAFDEGFNTACGMIAAAIRALEEPKHEAAK